MRKISYLLILVLAFASCEDYNDQFFDKLDEAGRAPDSKNIEITLSDDDYTAIGELAGESNIGKYKNFSSSLEPKVHIPAWLNENYTGLDRKSEIKITLNYYVGGLGYLNDIPEATEYELQAADYDAMGEGPGKYNNFSSSAEPEDYLPAFLLTKYPSAVDGDVRKIIYNYYSGGISTLVAFYELDGAVWAPWVLPCETYTLVGADYDSMGEPGSHDNFSSSVKPEDYVAKFADLKFPYAKADDKIILLYDYFYGKIDNEYVTKTNGTELIFDGANWSIVTGVIQKTEIFSIDNSVWAWVPPIKFIESTKATTTAYTLVDADYEMVGNGYYDNFDIRDGKPDAPVEIRIEKMTKIIKANFDVKVGNVYGITYDVYDGENKALTIVLEAVPDED